MEQSLIVALDFSGQKETADFLRKFKHEPLFVKVGMELFYKEGPAVMEMLKQDGHRIFLDLKLHDIPNTVYRAMKNLAALGADMVNVHAAGGSSMMEHAVEGLEAGTPAGTDRPSCIAVTQLTSTDEHMLFHELQIQRPLEEVVLHYAGLAQRSGLDGVVCSVHESASISKSFGREFIKVTPGIRPAGSGAGDQKRIAMPHEAKKAGSTAIVVGRAITQADDPVSAYQSIKKEWMGYDE
ncbi:orotidine-5'-phosphate decarboxylase [Bacillus marinisedimentorum]|uniref:orotidine-5'-phosphate decarboxylase n=1 Tax=Bacillus marinisedimentorum TaxID=1821260 RepID=UPI0007DEA0AD|nr:orotidine-5'-phosphate decarboxylase [Bacillus marinisedimentorum]